MNNKIPVSVIVATLNEEKNLPRCLAALTSFDEVIVVDSNSQDNSRAVAERFNARFENFTWNGKYPKKRQWCLDTLPIKHDFVFFVDADEEVTPDLTNEIANLVFSCPGYFVDGLYVVEGAVLKRGIRNRKLCLINRHKMEFPVVNDLDIPGMGEIEGHYQPVIKAGAKTQKTGKIKSALLHHALEDEGKWQRRHDGYAVWEQGMSAKKAYPKDPVLHREIVKRVFRAASFKGLALIIYYGLLRAGIFDGAKNIALIKKKAKYYDR